MLATHQGRSGSLGLKKHHQQMKARIGDTVRFLNQEGGGKVAKIEGRTVYVEDEDGFQIPVLDNDIVVIDESEVKLQGDAYSRSARNAQKAQGQHPKASASLPEGSSWRERIKADEEEEEDDEEEEIIIPSPRQQPKQPEKPKQEQYKFDADATNDAEPHFYVALTRTDGGNTGTLDLHVVNDSNYFASYAIMRTDGKGQSTLIAAATIEPNTKEKIDSLNPMQVDGQTWNVQLLMYKKIRSFTPQPVYNTEIKPRGVKMLRDGSFTDNDFFDSKALLMPVIKDEFAMKLEQLSEKELLKGAGEGRHQEPAKKSKPSRSTDIIEVDLHIDALLPDTRGLDNKDMLEVQMKHVRTTMEENIRTQGLRIVFIHGVGAGVLKGEIRRLLDRKYPKCQYQDASFREYGFGATMVTIA